jgi:hypothetical protein
MPDTNDQSAAEVVKVEPTLAIIRGEREESAAAAEKAKAEREENYRLQLKRSALGRVFDMSQDVDKKLAEIKAQKKLLKSLRDDLAAAEKDESLTVGDLNVLIDRGVEAVYGSKVHTGGIVFNPISILARSPLEDLVYRVS